MESSSKSLNLLQYRPIVNRLNEHKTFFCILLQTYEGRRKTYRQHRDEVYSRPKSQCKKDVTFTLRLQSSLYLTAY
jgi:hypothetical protein